MFTLNRPKSKNALGKAMMDEFRFALDTVRFDKDIRAVVLRSTVPRVFCAGADLKERAAMNPQEVAAFVYGLRAAFTGLAALPMPVIAAIHGAALGGGCELALAADLRVADTGLAIIPGAGGTQRLPRLVGTAKAKELIFTGRRVNAEEAQGMGLVDYATPEGGAVGKALELASSMLNKGPVALRMAKAAIDSGMQADLATGMRVEEACYAQVIPTEDRIEGLTAFREKRAPVYKGQ
ncbi:auh [Symbiodinium sp. KB8]|nr:auh [Symbiodinium sp. KB8]